MASRSKQSMLTPAPRLLGVTAAATYLGATVWAIRKLHWERTIPSIKIGQRLLFDINDLDKFIERQKLSS